MPPGAVPAGDGTVALAPRPAGPLPAPPPAVPVAAATGRGAVPVPVSAPLPVPPAVGGSVPLPVPPAVGGSVSPVGGTPAAVAVAEGAPADGVPLPVVEFPAVAAPARCAGPVRAVLRRLPSPTGTPFTFGYALLLLATSLYTEYGDPDTVSAVLRASSTDVVHLSRTPLLVLVASALWVAGGLFSPYAVGFLFVLTALERRIGGWRTAAVFLLGHVVATLATEIPVAFSVLAGHLPGTSLHRLDYGISFGLLASTGALAGLLTPLVRGAVLGCVSLMLVQDLLVLDDPLTNWGHPLALAFGVACWPLVRRAAARVTPAHLR